MTPLEIEEAARQRYNAVGDSHFPQAMIMDLIYHASMQLAVETKCIERTFSTTTVADQKEYSYPSNAIALKRVEYDGLEIHSVDLNDDPKTSTTEPTGRAGCYAIWNDELHLFPTPDSAVTLKIFAFVEPSAVTTTSTLEVPSEYHLMVIDFVMAYMFAKDKDPTMSAFHLRLWNEGVSRAKRDRAKRKRGDNFARVKDDARIGSPSGIIY
jgi:hypothetical protein